jgi:hypothetical protein
MGELALRRQECPYEEAMQHDRLLHNVSTYRRSASMQGIPAEPASDWFARIETK